MSIDTSHPFDQHMTEGTMDFLFEFLHHSNGDDENLGINRKVSESFRNGDVNVIFYRKEFYYNFVSIRGVLMV